MPNDEFVKVGQVSELTPGDMKTVKVGNEEVLLVNVDGDIHACDDVCTHSYASLSEGDLSGPEVECPLHGALFNVKSGAAITPPATEALRIFQVRLEGDDILVGPPQA